MRVGVGWGAHIEAQLGTIEGGGSGGGRTQVKRYHTNMCAYLLNFKATITSYFMDFAISKERVWSPLVYM
jgi:hypothetical protein